jgi:hypothetical protein
MSAAQLEVIRLKAVVRALLRDPRSSAEHIALAARRAAVAQQVAARA